VTCAEVLEKDKYQTNTTGVLELNCGDGKVVEDVLFADFGAPSGSCGDVDAGVPFAHNASCTSKSSVPVVEKLCLHKQRCKVDVTTKEFGGTDPCLKVPKRLAVNVTCRQAPTLPTPAPAPAPVPAPTPTPTPTPGPRHFAWNISIPVGSTATVHVPLLGADADRVAISVGGSGSGSDSDSTRSQTDGDDMDMDMDTPMNTASVVWDHGHFLAGTDGVRAAKASKQTDSIVLECGSGWYEIRMREG
jgi:hypothetical protein